MGDSYKDLCGGGNHEGSEDVLSSAEYSRLAQEGIQLMLNNKFIEAEEMFLKHINNSIHMAAGYSYLTFMNAVMSFEEEKIEHCFETLRSLERRCGGTENGWFSSVKNIVMGNSKYNLEQSEDFGHNLEQQIILADCHVLLSILTFLQQDLGSYVKSGWVMRKAWKVYEYSYTKVKHIYMTTFDDDNQVPVPMDLPINPNPTTPNEIQSPMSWEAASSSTSSTAYTRQSSINSVEEAASHTSSLASPTCSEKGEFPPRQRGFKIPMSKSVPNLRGILSHRYNNNKKPKIARDVVYRLMASVSFGYGLFQLCTSLLPPSLLKLVHILGLQGDRVTGISALMFTRKSTDMRSPLATLTLLWYHTIVRPFFALDGTKVKAGVDVAELLLDNAQQEYGHSALFLFFRGRVNRLKGDIGSAIISYKRTISASKQREIQLLALHELAWCHLLQLNWQCAQSAFLDLKKKSRWSKSFYTYLSGMCEGAVGNLSSCIELMNEVPSLIRRNNHTLELFISRRANKVNKESITQEQCLLRIFELLYLWNALPSVSNSNKQVIIDECNMMGNQNEYEALRQLILAATIISSGRSDLAVNHLRSSISKGKELQEELYIPVFASYELGLHLSSIPESQEEGRKLLEEARDQPYDYDFKNRLIVRILAALKSIS